jgi:hypothetical protein
MAGTPLVIERDDPAAIGETYRVVTLMKRDQSRVGGDVITGRTERP